MNAAAQTRNAVRTVQFVLTCQWADGSESRRALPVLNETDAVAQATQVRAAMQLVPSFVGCKLRREVRYTERFDAEQAPGFNVGV